jgi:SAM-dependent methyltransferase
MWSREIEQQVKEVFRKVDPGLSEVANGYFFRDAQPLFYNKIHLRETLPYLLSRELPATARILDYGCGTGQFLLFLSKFGFRNLHGWDQNPRWLQAGQAIFDELDELQNVSFRQIDRDAIYDIAGTAGEQFNVITMFGLIFGHAIDVPKTLVSVAQALSPGGYFIANDRKHSPRKVEHWLDTAGLKLQRSIQVHNQKGMRNCVYFCQRRREDTAKIQRPKS